MSYTVIARRWRPQVLDEVVGQRHVTQTLRNAITSGRIAQAFVFAGPRGVGKTTTARILARMLNCDQGPTADPCGVCDPCREIALGNDMDVLEMDAATHTQIDNIREIIISGLAVKPIRDRYKIFIIDEVHQLSNHSFNALLKSIEEPPPHVAFVMATTAPDKIPDTIVSRSQVFEFKTISSREIAEQLRKIADDPRDPTNPGAIDVSPEALGLIARAAEGSMRDAETAFDQVIAFAGRTITVNDVSTVLGLVARDLLFDVVQAVADEDGPAAFALAGRAVEGGYDLRLLCRELARLVRDLLVLSVDPGRMTDPDIAPDGDRERLKALLPRYSREDLLRAFDVLTRAEMDIRNAAEPRYHLEMALLKWIHLRKLTPLASLIEQLEGSGLPGRAPAASARPGPANQAPRPAAVPPPVAPARSSSPARPAAPASSSDLARRMAAAAPAAAVTVPAPPADGLNRPAGTPGVTDEEIVKTFVAEATRERPATAAAILGEARNIDLRGDRLVIAVGSSFLANQVNQAKPWLEPVLQRVAGRRLVVAAEVVDAPPRGGGDAGGGRAAAKDELMAAAKANPGVQTLLEIFPAEIKDVTELK